MAKKPSTETTLHDPEYYFLRSLFKGREVDRILSDLYYSRWTYISWSDAFQRACDELMEIGLLAQGMDGQVIVAYPFKTRKKRPFCLVLDAGSQQKYFDEALMSKTTSGWLHLVPSGVIDV